MGLPTQTLTTCYGMYLEYKEKNQNGIEKDDQITEWIRIELSSNRYADNRDESEVLNIDSVLFE